MTRKLRSPEQQRQRRLQALQRTQRRRAAQLCSQCGKPASEANKALCEGCRDKALHAYLQRKVQGQCVQCLGPRDRPNGALCRLCIVSMRDRATDAEPHHRIYALGDRRQNGSAMKSHGLAWALYLHRIRTSGGMDHETTDYES